MRGAKSLARRCQDWQSGGGQAGEKIPLDGIIRAGNTQVDTSALTGESMPRGVA